MNDIEREAIILNSAWKMIDGMVNWAMFVRTDLREPTNLMFQDDEHARMFVILLGDFLSQVRALGSQAAPFGLRAAPADAHPSTQYSARCNDSASNRLRGTEPCATCTCKV
ncbi:MAG: hypothetical protein OXF33_09105 [Rhodospirillales bacterium]|nr:hypothetical protein [Rhodospirillales bacterium]